MIEKYHDPIYTLLSEKGALGVNQIAQLTGIALSTVQKYLTSQQTYFRKTADRKWDLPERVAVVAADESFTNAINVLENSIGLFKSQLEEIQIAASNLSLPINSLKRVNSTNRTAPPPVADVDLTEADLDKTVEDIKQLSRIFKDRKETIPSEYYEILMNTKWLAMCLDMGRNWIKEVLQPELYDLVLGTKTNLPSEIQDIIREYQK